MADSNITKNALANALKSLLEEMPFQKISVSDICARCDMNRKSFYYHFRDKYELANWIFDTDFLHLMQQRHDDDRWAFIEQACNYFYTNRSFYYKVLQIHGQDCFSEHFTEMLHPILRERVEEITGESNVHPMIINFIADGIMCAFERWILDKNCMPPGEFVTIMKDFTQMAAVHIQNEKGT